MCHVGIDVGQETLDVVVAVGSQRQRWQVPNAPAGICTLVAHVQAAACTQIALEPTGPYHVPVAEALQRAGLPVGLVGSTELHAYRRVLGRRHKTDAADAELLARYAQTHPHALRPVGVMPREQQRLRALVRYRDQLVRHRVRLSQQREAAAWHGWTEVVAWQDADLAWLRAREQEITAKIEQHLAVFAETEPLQAMVGVGPLTVASVLAYLPCELWGWPRRPPPMPGWCPSSSSPASSPAAGSVPAAIAACDRPCTMRLGPRSAGTPRWPPTGIACWRRGHRRKVRAVPARVACYGR